MILPRVIAAAIEAQARAEAPNESCGVIIGDGDPRAGGQPLRYVPCRNEAASPTRFRMHPDDVSRLVYEIDDTGETLWGFVHSHVRTAAVPSRRDIEMAAWWPDSLAVLISLAAPEAEVRAWSIVDGAANELPIEWLEVDA